MFVQLIKMNYFEMNLPQVKLYHMNKKLRFFMFNIHYKLLQLIGK